MLYFTKNRFLVDRIKELENHVAKLKESYEAELKVKNQIIVNY